MNITNLSVSVADNRSKARPYLSKMQAISARLNRLYYTGKMMNNVGCCLSAGGEHFLDQQESFKQRKILFEFLELHNESGKVSIYILSPDPPPSFSWLTKEKNINQMTKHKIS